MSFDELTFKNWIKKRQTDENWIIVAQNVDYEKDGISYDYFTTSVLVHTEDSSKLVEDHLWLSDTNYGNQCSYGEVGQTFDEIVEYANTNSKTEGVVVFPFTIYRTWSVNYVKNYFHVIEDFILFYNLYWDSKTKKFMAIADTGEDIEVIRILSDSVLINTIYLKNYLAAEKMYLVRHHDHRIHLKEDIAIKRTEQTLFEKDYSFSLFYDYSTWRFDGYKIFSRLLGRDVIEPARSVVHLLGDEEKYCEFIVGNKDGKNIEASCNEDDFPNQSNRTVTFLTVVCFKPEVLKKYRDSPEKYKVTEMDLFCGGLWSMPIGVNSAGLVTVYLGDLAKLPYVEQLYWKSFNVLPEGGISKDKFERDFEAKFASPTTPEYLLKKSYDDINKSWKEKFGFELFERLPESDQYKLENLSLSRDMQRPEFDSMINSLLRVFPEAINQDELKKLLTQQGIQTNGIRGSINLLETFLSTNGHDISAIDPMREISEYKNIQIHKKQLKPLYTNKLKSQPLNDILRDNMLSLRKGLDNINKHIQ